MNLITGGLGFLGSNLAEALVHQGQQVLLVSKSNRKLKNVDGFKDKVGIAYGDMSDVEWVQQLIRECQPNVVFHFAGQVTSYESFENPFYDVDINAKSTLAILEAMRELKKPCRFILGSTLWVVGHPEKLPINEKTPCWPRNVYGIDRLASEHYCRVYHDVYDLDTVIMRMSNTFGIREQYDNVKKAALNYLLYKGYKGEPITLYSKGQVSRDYIYISDVVSAAEAIMSKGKAGECYFIASGVETWFADAGKWMAELTGAELVYVDPPDFHKRIDIGNIRIDNRKLKSLGWDSRVSVKDGLSKTLEYYKQLGV